MWHKLTQYIIFYLCNNNKTATTLIKHYKRWHESGFFWTFWKCFNRCGNKNGETESGVVRILHYFDEMREKYVYFGWMDSKIGQYWFFLGYHHRPAGWDVNEGTNMNKSIILYRRTSLRMIWPIKTTVVFECPLNLVSDEVYLS